ncbi:virulence protein RhuM/Fic/DOC family protein [Candidatus Saccharibacteria bacterium]|nr:virulence protein RhuM/Fic/DOC family protein [Candidatus Saccharibacteria bacterium]
MEESKAVVMYQGEEGEVVFDVSNEEETIWATQEQIAQLFGVTVANVNMHLKKIYKEEELAEKGTIQKNLIVRREGNRQVRRAINFYNLDAIISVGYRVNSKKATKFRVWATGVLKKYMLGGVAVNERRVKELSEGQLEEIEGALKMVRRLMEKTELEEGEAKGVLEVIAKYGKALETIREFDEGKQLGTGFLERSQFGERRGGAKRQRRGLTGGDVRNLVENLREELDEREEFGEFKDEERFEETLRGLMTEETEMSGAERAVRLLYMIVKERPFRDGNRRIGALLFIYYLTINDFHLSAEGETKISDRALTAIVLLMAESEEREKELMIGVVRKLIEG